MNNTKEMIYTENRKIELLYNNIYKGFHYYILNLGTHPTAYVEIPKEHYLYQESYIDIEEYYSIDVHGGLTYSDDSLRIGENTTLMNTWFIGWDYAHCDDYSVLYGKGKKWTTSEIIKDCENVIKQISLY